MLSSLQERTIEKNNNPKIKKKHNLKEYFNTTHFKKLFQSKNRLIISKNLKTTQQVLCRHIRKSMLLTPQKMEDRSMLMYMNVLKVSSLRMCNEELAVRFQGAWVK